MFNTIDEHIANSTIDITALTARLAEDNQALYVHGIGYRVVPDIDDLPPDTRYIGVTVGTDQNYAWYAK